MATILVIEKRELSVSHGAVAPLAPVLESTPVTLSAAKHLGKLVTLNDGATLTVDVAQTAVGFTCIVINNTGADLTPTLTGFGQSTLRNAFGLTKLASGGMVTLIVDSPDGGATKYVRAAGELI